MNKLEEYILRYQGLHSGTDEFLTTDGKLRLNNIDPNKGKVIFDGSQLGKKFPSYIQQVINTKGRAITLLDYGSGKAIHTHIPLSAHGNKTLLGRFNGMIQCYYAYDPAVKEYSMKPPTGMAFDLTCCADVMEHVPEEFVSVVLTEIGNYTKEDGTMLFSISGNLAKKMFSDGENLHATVKPLQWWVDAIRSNCGNKSFVLIYDNDSEPVMSTSTKQTGAPCNTSIRYYNSQLFSLWHKDVVDSAYYDPANIEEVK